MQKQLVRSLERQERQRVEEAKAALVLQYEDMLWRAAETSAAEADLLADADVRATLSLVGKTIEHFVADLADIRQRIAMQSQIETYLAADVEAIEVQASLAAIDAEEAAAKEAFEARRKPLRKQLGDCKRRMSDAGPARKHYRITAPDWLRQRIKEVGERILKLEQRRESKPSMPSPLERSAANASTSLQQRQEFEQRYQDRIARYEDRLVAWQEAETERKTMIALLECERATLEPLQWKLRPVEADAQDG